MYIKKSYNFKKYVFSKIVQYKDKINIFQPYINKMYFSFMCILIILYKT